MRNHLRLLLLATGLIGCGGDDDAANEVLYTDSVTVSEFCALTPSMCCDNCAGAPSLVLTLTGAATNPTGDATLTLALTGDFDNVDDETLRVTVEGISLGTILNGDTGDDSFDLPSDTTEDCTPTTTSATLSRAQLAAIVADGTIAVTLSPDQGNNDIEGGLDDVCVDSITLSVSYPAIAD